MTAPAAHADSSSRTLAVGDSATIARTADGSLWQWDGGAGPRRLTLR